MASFLRGMLQGAFGGTAPPNDTPPASAGPGQAGGGGDDDDTAPRAGAAPVHVMREDGLVTLVDGHLAFGVPGGKPELVRLDEVSQLSLFGRAGITTPCLTALMQRGIPVVFRSVAGFYLGQTADLSGVAAAVRRAQYRTADDPVASLALARVIVRAKIVNQRGVLRRHGIGKKTLDHLARMARDAMRASEPSRLVGIEGAAAAAYYAAMPGMIVAERHADFPWDGRRRRPPGDPVNCSLSYLYAILAGECAAAALAAGLDPTVGFLHRPAAGRPSLALDLMEPFRPAVADAAVLSAINRNELRSEHFAASGGGLRLGDTGRRTLVAAIERRWRDPVPAKRGGEATKTTWREATHIQARRAAESLVAGKPFAAFERG